MIQKIWKNRDTVFYLPANSNKANLTCELFNGMKSCTPIYISRNNAYSDIEQMVIHAKSFSNDTLFLARIGPTATVLTARLSKLGY